MRDKQTPKDVCEAKVVHGSYVTWASPQGLSYSQIEIYGIYIYLKKIKIMYFIFVLFFLGHPRHPPPGLKKQQQQQIILRGSGACRLGSNLVPRGKARRWLNLLHTWNGKRQQKHRWIPHDSKAAALKARGWLKLSHWWNSRRLQNYSFLVCFQTT